MRTESAGGINDKAVEVVEKPSNPKDSVGVRKVPMSTVSSPVLMEIGLGMLEGALKYGRHNYRVVGVRASVYFDAAKRHLDSYWEGEDLDPESQVGLHHISKCIASLVVLRDAMIQGKLEDDRPPKSPEGWLKKLNEMASRLVDMFPNPKTAWTELNKEQG